MNSLRDGDLRTWAEGTAWSDTMRPAHLPPEILNAYNAQRLRTEFMAGQVALGSHQGELDGELPETD